MAKLMKQVAVISFLLTVGFVILYQNIQNTIVLSLAITFGTIAYHFIIRLLVGHIFEHVLCIRHCARGQWVEERV